MDDTTQYNFRMQIAGEKPFEVLRFGWDPAGYHDDPSLGANSDSTNAAFLGRRRGLQLLCGVIESMKTMLFTKSSDLVTVRLVEAYLQRKTLDHIFFVASETANGKRTPVWVASLFMKDVSIVNLKTRQQFGPEVNGYRYMADFVNLRANEVTARDFDSQGNMEVNSTPWWKGGAVPK